MEGLNLEELLQATKDFRKMIDSITKATQKLVKESDLSEEEMLEFIDVYPSWKIGAVYEVDEFVKYGDALYKCTKEHTSDANLNPERANYLFTKVKPTNVIPEWTPSEGYLDVYNTGDQVTFEGKVYESTIDNNTWSPTAYPAGWKEIK